MRKSWGKRLVPMVVMALSVFTSGPAIAKTCDLDTVPAATLLLPYFEVDVSGAVPRSADTAFTVLNTSTEVSQLAIAHVTLWTDWAIPTASFDLTLGASDEQSINVIDLFVEGAQGIAGCIGGPSGVMHFNRALPVTGRLEEDLEVLRKAHTGVAMNTPMGPKVASSPHPNLAKGYITIDVVRRCTALFPSSPRAQGYFRDGGTGIATNDNVLTGDYLLVDSVAGVGLGEPMVHIRADKTFKPGNYTFYGRYVGGTAIDDRQPLGSVYSSRFWTGTPDPATNPQTHLIVWRDTKGPAPALFPVGGGPSPIPLKQMWGCDENENCGLYPGSLPLATQKKAVNLPGGIMVPYAAGWMKLDLNHGRTSLFGAKAQGYVTTLFTANVWGGGVATGFRATRLQTPCTQN